MQQPHLVHHICSSCPNWIPDWDTHTGCLACRKCKCLDPKHTWPCDKVCQGWKPIQWSLMLSLYRKTKGLGTVSPSPDQIAATASLEIKMELEKKAKESVRLTVTPGPVSLTGSGSSAGGGGKPPPPPPPRRDEEVTQTQQQTQHQPPTGADDGLNSGNAHGDGHTPNGGTISGNQDGGGGDAYSLTSIQSEHGRVEHGRKGRSSRSLSPRRSSSRG